MQKKISMIVVIIYYIFSLYGDIFNKRNIINKFINSRHATIKLGCRLKNMTRQTYMYFLMIVTRVKLV